MNVDSKKIQVTVSNECNKKLKILAIQKDSNVSQIAKELLEKITSNKKYDMEDVNI